MKTPLINKSVSKNNKVKYRKGFYKNVMKPLSNKNITKYDFIGFDVETYGKYNKFLMGGLYYYNERKEPIYKSFWNKKEMIKFISNYYFFKGKYIVATNLSFDFNVLFYGEKEFYDFNIIYRGSDIILASKTFKNSNKKGKIKFIDTFNYAKFSVSKLGSIIGNNKADKPIFLGKNNLNYSQRLELTEYNKQDCKISCDFMYFLQKGVNKANGKLKSTIASCSLDIWRRNFLEQLIIKENYLLKKDIKGFIYKGYYGGRTEAYKKGLFKNIFYYDINSLYPSVMINDYPLPNSVKEIKRPNKYNIVEHFGVSECEVICPDNLDKPLLPYRLDGKLTFPKGKFTGVFNHIELKKAYELGYKIKPIKQIIYTKSWKPFNKFVKYFYNERKILKSKKSSMEKVFKIILNSLYGKFAQKKIDKLDIIKPKTIYEVNELYNYYDSVDSKDMIEFFCIKKQTYNGVCSFPIISSYVTSYARLKMYDYINHKDVLYSDTDSVMITKELYQDSKKLGEMKLEHVFKEVLVVKPKMYYFVDKKDNREVKIKGLNRAKFEDMLQILDGKKVSKMRFIKFRESFRRNNLKVNQIVNEEKGFDLEDNKREWKLIKDSDKYIEKVYDSIPLVV